MNQSSEIIEDSGESLVNELVGQKGLIIDSVNTSAYLVNYVQLRGGNIELFEYFTNDVLEYIKQEGITFVIIHNYLISELRTLKQVARSGVKILLLKRMIIPPEQVEEHEKICRELKNEGVIIGSSMYRVNAIRRFLLNLNELPQTTVEEG